MKEKIVEKETSGIFITGVIFIVFCSIVTGILNIGVLYLCGIPLLGLILGIVFVWVGKVNVNLKIAATLLPLPIIILSFLLIFQITKAEPETFLIPKDLRGEIVVFYAESCGQPPLYENGRRIYKIPESGVLITRFKKNSGHLDQKFYLVDESKNKTEIPQFHWQDFETEQRNWKHFNSTPATELTKDSVGAFWAYGAETYGISKNSLSYIIATFGYYEKDSKIRWLERKNFTKKANALYQECR